MGKNFVKRGAYIKSNRNKCCIEIGYLLICGFLFCCRTETSVVLKFCTHYQHFCPFCGRTETSVVLKLTLSDIAKSEGKVEPKQVLYWNLSCTSPVTSSCFVEPKQVLYWNGFKSWIYRYKSPVEPKQVLYWN